MNATLGICNHNSDPLFSMKEAALYLSVSLSKMYEIVKQHKLPVVRITNDIKIRKSVLDKFIANCEGPWRVEAFVQ